MTTFVEAIQQAVKDTEQEMIEKACKAYCKMCDINCDSGDTCNGLETFKKCMEEE